MRYTTVVFSALLLLVLSALGLGQSASPSAKPEPPTLDLPKGDNAWALRVVRSGGLNADTFLDVTIKSTGQLTIDSGQGKRESTISTNMLMMLGPVVLSAKFPKVASPGAVPAGCFDCYTTVITVRRREPKGKERTYSAAWVPTAVGSVSEEFVSISRLALGLSN
jgi:hypothetical protein